MTLRLNSDDLQFEKFNGFQTKYEYIEFGTLEETKSRNFSLGGSVGAGTSSSNATFDDAGNQTGSSSSNFGPSATGSFGSSGSRTENISIKGRTISQAGMLSGNQLIVYLEGMPLKNLNGPIDIEVTLSANSKKVTDKEFVAFSIKDKKPQVTTKFLIKPDQSATGDIKGEVELEWSYRKVVKNGKTSFEGDDIIELYNSPSTKYKVNEVIIPKDDLIIPIFNLTFNGTQAYLKSKAGTFHALTFVTREEAVRFRNYCVENSVVSIDDYSLTDDKKNGIVVADLNKLGIESDEF